MLAFLIGFLVPFEEVVEFCLESFETFDILGGILAGKEPAMREGH